MAYKHTKPHFTTGNTCQYFYFRVRIFIIDPATPYESEQTRFDQLLERLTAEGKKLKAVVLSHHHHDHVGDARRVALKWGLPIWGHKQTSEKLGYTFERYLVDGDYLGRWQALHTPGHAVGHLCFWCPEQRSLIAADMVAEESTIIIEPHDGGTLKAYMESLRRLIALEPKTLTPSHGHLRTDGVELLRKTLSHREKRIEQICYHLSDATQSLTARGLVEAIYAGDIPEAVYPLAELSGFVFIVFIRER